MEGTLPVAVFFSTVLSDTIKLWRHYPQCDLLPPVEVAETRVVKFQLNFLARALIEILTQFASFNPSCLGGVRVNNGA